MPAITELLRELSSEHFTSGARIAEHLDVSRAHVSGILAHAEEFGVRIERRHGLGYRLETPIEWLDPALIQAELPAESALRIEVVSCIDSTNRTLLADPRHGRVLAAEWQDGGRGRLGRKWIGALGGSLLFSLAWTFPGGPAQLAGLPLAIGASLADTLARYGVRDIGLKWPNDLLLPNGKVGGILIEMQGDALGPSHIVIGIGLNLCLPDYWQASLDQPAATLAAAGLQANRNQILSYLLTDLESTLQQFSREGFSSLQARWEARHAWQNADVEIRAPDGKVIPGKVLGVTADGSLRLLTEKGETCIHTGDVSLRKRHAPAD